MLYTSIVVITIHDRDGNHLQAMLWRVRTLRRLLNTPVPWQSMARYYPRLVDIVDRAAELEKLPSETIIERIIQMYRRYIAEWDDIQPIIERGLLQDEELRAAT